ASTQRASASSRAAAASNTDTPSDGENGASRPTNNRLASAVLRKAGPRGATLGALPALSDAGTITRSPPTLARTLTNRSARRLHAFAITPLCTSRNGERL